MTTCGKKVDNAETFSRGGGSGKVETVCARAKKRLGDVSKNRELSPRDTTPRAEAGHATWRRKRG